MNIHTQSGTAWPRRLATDAPPSVRSGGGSAVEAVLSPPGLTGIDAAGRVAVR
jgi:hypothetical protein